MTGDQFTKSFLTPIQPMSLLSMVQSGWPVEFVFGTAVRSINGVANGTRAHLLHQDPDPEFGELLQALTQIQQSSSIDIRIDRRPDGEVAVLVIKKGDLGPVAEARRQVREILDLGAEVSEFRLEYGSIDDRDFASKRRFSFLLLLTSLAETGASPSAPLITVGAGGG